MSRYKEMYNTEIRESMKKKFGYKNVMEIPKLEKIVVNMGVGEAKDNAKLLDSAVTDLEKITGQHCRDAFPLPRHALHASRRYPSQSGSPA